jgi:glycerol-3-phosphate O-acyltransferase
MKKFTLLDWAPWNKRVDWYMETRTTDDMKKILLETTSVKEAMGELIAKKLAYYKNTLKLDVDENNIYKEIRKEASDSIGVIMADFNPTSLKIMATSMVSIFKRIYTKIVVNETQVEKIRALAAVRKGPIILCPNHRSYLDFMVLSVVALFYHIDVPHICAGEDLMHIKGVSPFLRQCGAFFMRRTFRGDPLYRAIFFEYVGQLVQDRHVMEFFVEGTRSRSNKCLQPKFGIL